ncbi:MAG: outer membrane beta-barrel protein [Alphaproteobacteria bacterium]|nr:outer membrane beta-barrel protein [Alphaproteobacteria bacterium]
MTRKVVRAMRLPGAVALKGAVMVAIASVAGAGAARAVDGPYVTGGAGASFLRESDIDARSGGTTGAGTLDYKPGFRAHGGIGWTFLDRFRVEAEGSWSRNGVDSATVKRVGNQSIAGAQVRLDDIKGDVDIYQAGINAYIDFPIEGRLVPYLGAGAAWTPIKLGDLKATVSGTTFAINDPPTKHLLAVNAMAGVGYKITDQLSASVGYRFSWIPGDFEFTDSATRASVTLDYGAHSVGAALRFSFGPSSSRPTLASASALAPNVPPPNAPPPTDWDMTAPPPAPPPMPVVRPPMAAAPPASAAAPPPVEDLARAASGAYGVQVGAYRDRREAERAWPDVRARYRGLLTDAQPVVVRADLRGRGVFHRLYAGGLSQADARRICQEIKRSGRWCDVARL